MNRIRQILLLTCGAAVLLAGCKKDEPTPVDLGFGLQSDIAGVKTVSGYVALLRLF